MKRPRSIPISACLVLGLATASVGQTLDQVRDESARECLISYEGKTPEDFVKIRARFEGDWELIQDYRLSQILRYRYRGQLAPVEAGARGVAETLTQVPTSGPTTTLLNSAGVSSLLTYTRASRMAAEAVASSVPSLEKATAAAAVGELVEKGPPADVANVLLPDDVSGNPPVFLPKVAAKLAGRPLPEARQFSVLTQVLMSAPAGPAGTPADSPFRRDDALFTRQWYLQEIGAPRAWNVQPSGDIVVAVLDTGIDFLHPDLSGAIAINYLELIGEPGKDDDNNTVVDDIYGVDLTGTGAVGISSMIAGFDDNGHGTHVSGIIGATADRDGIVGVAPGVKILPIRFLNREGVGNLGAAIEGIEYARKRGAKIVNNSWSLPLGTKATDTSVPLLRRKIAEASDALLVFAASNDGNDNDANPVYPSSFRVAGKPYVMSVMAVERDSSKATYSNFGKTSVDIAAPGGSAGRIRGHMNDEEDILSTSIGKPGEGLGTFFAADAGTSAAAAVASGAAALIWSHKDHRDESAAAIRDLLVKNARKVDGLTDQCVAGGVLDLSFLDPKAPAAPREPDPSPPLAVRDCKPKVPAVCPRCGEPSFGGNYLCIPKPKASLAPAPNLAPIP